METHNYYPENEADRILSAIVRDDRPHYRSEDIARKAKTDRRLARRYAATSTPRCEACTFLTKSAMRHVVRAADLTKRQIQVLRARLAGCGWLEIGCRFGHTRQAAQSIFKQAMRKVRQAYSADPYAGLDEVYRQEVSRHLPRRH
ncbi:MAG: hypothetical protein ABIV13_07280 [Fimbriimonadales bacterium]